MKFIFFFFKFFIKTIFNKNKFLFLNFKFYLFIKVDNKTSSHISNLNWFLYYHYVRKDYDFCEQIIEKQLKEYLNPEYLYFIKVSISFKS